MKEWMKSVVSKWVLLCFVFCYFENAAAISDPRDITTKPPIRRESVLPWYLNDGDPIPPIDFSASEQQSENKNTARRKSINSVLAAVSAHSRDSQSFIDESNTDKSSYYPNTGNKNVNYGNNNLYEGVPVNSKKPTLVLLPPPETVNTVAKYVKESGVVECPDRKATGRFVYPPDCKYFVNCNQGRAEVQLCPPGTLFCSKSLECDFPSKVSCYNSERVARNSRRQSQGSADFHYNAQLKALREPKCPPNFTGYLPHPETCFKFIQCDRGGTFIKDCGPGTAFNPKISVCDWPYKVPACANNRPNAENTNSHQGNSGVRPNPYESGNSGDRDGRYGWTDRPEVPPSGGGTYPPNGQYNEKIHKEGSEGQYENGEMEIDPRLGPPAGYSGSRRNYGQPTTSQSQKGHYGNREDSFPSYPDQDNSQTIAGQWSTDGYLGSRPNGQQPVQRPNGQNQYGQNTWQWNSEKNEHFGEASNHHRVNAGHAHDVSGSWNTAGNRRQDEEGLSQTSSGSWGYAEAHGNSRNDGGFAQSPPESWGHSGYQNSRNDEEGLSQTSSGSWGFQNSRNNEGLGQISSGSRGHSGYQNSRNDEEGLGQTSSGSWGHTGFQNSRNNEGLGQTSPESWGHSGFQNSRNNEEGLSQTSSNGSEGGWTGYHHDHGHENEHHQHHHHHHHHPPGHVQNHENGNWQDSRPETPTSGYPGGDRTGYGRTHPDFPPYNQEGPNRPSGYPQPGRRSETPNSRPEHSFPARPSWNNRQSNYDDRQEMRPSLPETTDPQSGVFVPSSWGTPNWNDRTGSIPTSYEPTQPDRNQGNNPRDQKMDNWGSKTNVLQQGDKRWDQDSKMDEWSSKTNIFGAQQGNQQQGAKSPIAAPSGIYVNVNGTRGHYITKEIEVNQGHSNTRSYGQQTTEIPQIDGNVSNRGTGTQPRWKPMRYKPANETSSGKVENSIKVKKEQTRWTPMRYKPKNETKYKDEYPSKNYQQTLTTESPNFESYPGQGRGHREPGIELPTVRIENDYSGENVYKRRQGKEDETIDFGDIVEPNTDNYEIEVLDKESWKPHLEFNNQRRDDSNVMKINKKDRNLEILDVKLEPWFEEEPPFPIYYVAPVHPLGFVNEPKMMTPATGQVLRLRGGSSPETGYLEVQGEHPGWGIVCDSWNGWSLNEAHIVCRQLGYTRGAEMAWQGRIEHDNNEISWIAATKVDCKGNETQFQACKFVHGDGCNVKRDAVGVRCMANRVAHCRDDEIGHEGRCYHLANPDSALNHAEALEYCLSRKAHLLDVTSQAESNFLSEWLMQKYPDVKSVMTSGVGFTTFNKTLWLWEDSAKAKFQFNKWWPGWTNDKKIPPYPGSRPVCIVLKKQFPCHNNPDNNCTTDYFFWEAEDCAASMKGHSYVCERSYDDIGCVYGKGQLYTGKANISATGKKCVNWNDSSFNYVLDIMAINSDIRKELMTHSYCRNPSPSKDSRPWCFVTKDGDRETCDIPPCGETDMKRTPAGGKCKPKHFECMPGECIPSPWVCDGQEDCTNGLDEASCSSHLGFFKKAEQRRLKNHDTEKWMNTPVKTCALRCKEADFQCRSFSHNSKENICYLSDANIGLTGDLIFDADYTYYEMIDRSVNCENMFICGNGKCLNRTKVCDGKNDCGDRSDENICSAEKLDYDIRLAGSNHSHEGRVEVKVLGHWGQVCDDGFGMNAANVVCKELGFKFGALEIILEGYYGNMDPPDRFMVDQLKCRGNETSLRECDFEGWGVHNCRPEEAVGVICISEVNTCKLGHWKCKNSPKCISTNYICDEVDDCPDKSDENPEQCSAPFELRLVNGSNPLEGRVEVRHRGIWGTVCDDDFTETAAGVICRSLGYSGEAVAKKDGFFGSGTGPIWLDEIYCHGNETQIDKCEHNSWGRNNCDHSEDVGVICSKDSVDDSKSGAKHEKPKFNINDILPTDCGRRPEDFSESDDGIFQRVVRGSIAPKGSYPWQASLRIRGHSRSTHWCGAVVLSPLHVLTAAHCLEGYNKAVYFVRAGDYSSEVDEGTEVEANIEDYYIHEDFGKGQRMNNDIALVLLKGRGIPLGEHIMPICLPPKDAEYPPGLNCTISGFGSIQMGDTLQSLDLRYGWVPLIDQSICTADYIYGSEKISDGMICAGFLDEGVDTCDGDSGGPLACQKNGAFTLYGITSWGHHCGEPNKPGVYVRIARYRDWIDKKIRESLFGR